jgi:hypothetical protein
MGSRLRPLWSVSREGAGATSLNKFEVEKTFHSVALTRSMWSMWAKSPTAGAFLSVRDQWPLSY